MVAGEIFVRYTEEHFPLLLGRKVRLFLWFPWNNTKHDDTVVQLSKGNISGQYVRVEFSLEDIDMSRFQQGATYEQIQEWVKEKYGLHVTHLNIAKTKRKCGIIERQNYNLPKSEDSRSPETPKEKEEAIIDVFKHFQMIWYPKQRFQTVVILSSNRENEWFAHRMEKEKAPELGLF